MKNKQTPPSLHDSQKVFFVTGEPSLAPGEVELQHRKRKEIVRPIEEVKKDWGAITAQITEMVSSTDSTLEKSTRYELDEIEISLAFSAKGKLGFIAEAGTEATVKVTLKRKS